MIKIISIIIGFDFQLLKKSKGKKNESVIYLSFFSLLLIFSLSFFSLYHAFMMTIEDVFLSVLLSIFLILFLLNTYRLIFSISEGEFNNTNNNIFKIVSFLLKRSIVLIVLSIFISKSLETIVFQKNLNIHIRSYKAKLMNDYDRLQYLSSNDQIKNAQNDYEEKVAFDKIIEKDRLEIHKQELNKTLLEIEDKLNKNHLIVKKTISESNFFITKIKILSSKIPFSWLFTLLMIVLFISPIYIFLTHPLFIYYDTFSNELNKNIISKEYSLFKNKYNELASQTIGEFHQYHENYQDPPFNTLKIKSSLKILKKGSLLNWFQNYGG